MDSVILAEIWDHIKEDIQEKNKTLVLKNLLRVLEDNGVIDEDDLRDLRDHDEYCEDAVEMIYKEADIEHDDFDVEEIEDLEW